jgi:hypothetical protein
MTEQRDFLKRIIDALEQTQIPYMLSGSVSSSLHGLPRATNDVDIVIAPTESQLERLAGSLGKECYVNPDTAWAALRDNSMFNVIDGQAGWKADFVIRKTRPFSAEEFGRRRRGNLMGLDVWVVSPEDAILSKLEWSRGRADSIQFRDAVGVATVQWPHLDRDYLNRWAKQLRLESLLSQLLDEAKKCAESKEERKLEQ